MGAKTNYLKNALLDHYLGQSQFSVPTPYLGLFVIAPTDAGGGTEVAGGGYVRKDVSSSFAAAAGGQSPNTADVEFDQASAAWGSVEAYGIFDAATSGNLLLWGYMIQNRYDFTADPVTDEITSPGHGLSNGDSVILEADHGSPLPGNVIEGDTYYVINASGDTFKLSTAAGGATHDMTTAGTGTIGRVVRKDIEAGDKAIFYSGTFIFTED